MDPKRFFKIGPKLTGAKAEQHHISPNNSILGFFGVQPTCWLKRGG